MFELKIDKGLIYTDNIVLRVSLRNGIKSVT